jgi:hypothetical protein
MKTAALVLCGMMLAAVAQAGSTRLVCPYRVPG